MSNNPPIRVLILAVNAGLRERAGDALHSPEFLVATDPVQGPRGEPWQVLITDRASPSREQVAVGCQGTIGIGIDGELDVSLPVDFTDRELQLAVHLVARIAELTAERNQLAEAHSAVSELAETDPLTSLPNRRAWQRRVPLILARAELRSEPAWLALLDLDGFKSINDRLGMSGGDEVLTECANSLVAALRRDDLVARLGGDEFGILLVGADDQRIAEVGARLLASVAAGGKVTASLGLVKADASSSEAELLSAAEGAMRKAKHAGGNKALRST